LDPLNVVSTHVRHLTISIKPCPKLS
jgi:hypothetical protein